MKRSQASIELIIFVGISLIILLFYFTFIFNQTQKYNLEKEKMLGQDVINKVKTEIELADTVSNGYHRDFVIPETLEGINYNITISDRELTLSTENFQLIKIIPEVIGNIQKNINTLKKEDNVIYLN
ncbi:MAG: hypothetical protein V1663_01910 [archaeon]